MSNTNTLPINEKKRLWIFIAIAFGVTLLMSIPMYFGFKHGVDLSVFVTAQMYYPACGVILGKLLIKREGESLPLVGYYAILAGTVLLMALAIVSLFTESKIIAIAMSVIIVIASLIAYIVFWACGREKMENAGVRRKNIKTSVWIIALFLALFVIQTVIATYLTGLRDGDVAKQFAELTDPFKKPMTWVTLFSLIINFPFAFSAFFGEEYGWRYYLQPLMQKKYGLIGGLILLGIVWGIWHLDVDMMYYSKDTGIQMFVSQIITCVSYAIFFGYAYLKTQNIWVPVIIHYLNNNLAAVFAGGDTSVLENQVVTWGDIPIHLVAMLVFAIFIFAPIFRKKKEIQMTE